MYTGVALRMKSVGQQHMESLLLGIFMDSYGGKQKKQKGKREASDSGEEEDKKDELPGLVNLRFEENFLTRKACAELQ